MPSTKITAKTSASQTKISKSTSKSTSSESTPKDQPGFIFGNSADADGNSLPPDSSFEDDTPKGLDGYDDRYIAFVDILGFKELIYKSVSDPNSVGALISALDIAPKSPTIVLEEVNVSEQDVDLRLHTFSDFVVASTKPTHGGLGVLAFVIWQLSNSWLSSRLLCRGGIARGQVLHRATDGEVPPMVFGPAFVEAYQLESTVADFPRVILSKTVRNDWNEYSKSGKLGEKLPLLIQRCQDGPNCVDTFCHLKRDGFDLVSSELPMETKQMQQALMHHLDDTAENPATHRKALWLAKKFNVAVLHSRYGDLKIDIDDGD